MGENIMALFGLGTELVIPQILMFFGLSILVIIFIALLALGKILGPKTKSENCVRCKNCGGQISRSAAKCPRCGSPSP